MATAEMTKSNNGTEVAASKKELPITGQVLSQINKMTNDGQLTLPANYNAGNALASAWLMLQDIETKDKRLIIQNGQPTGAVTIRSIANALTEMVTQGLNPAKTQCYFIVYGDKLTHQRSYFGDMALAERVMPGITFDYDIVRKNDEVAIKKVRTDRNFVTIVQEHTKTFPGGGEILGAYCGVFGSDGADLGYDVFDMDRIQRSWSKSKTAGYDNSTHKVYTDEMCLRTVIRHRCKSIINSSSDELLVKALRAADADNVESEVAEQAAINANQDVIDVTATVHRDDTPESANDAPALKLTTTSEEAPF